MKYIVLIVLLVVCLCQDNTDSIINSLVEQQRVARHRLFSSTLGKMLESWSTMQDSEKQLWITSFTDSIGSLVHSKEEILEIIEKFKVQFGKCPGNLCVDVTRILSDYVKDIKV